MSEEIDDNWSFESDYACLKNNNDYKKLLKTLALLETQRIQAIQDLETVRKEKDEALADPMAFALKVRKGKDLYLPVRIKVVEFPTINWNNYGKPKTVQYNTRLRRNGSKAQGILAMKKSKQDERANTTLVRGRPCDESKPRTFNRLWSCEEQRRLEELLVVFPPEEVEQNRWKKIAAALGNRTPKQVTSRIQKYFIKLHKAGLPVPGRIPRVYGESRGPRHHHQKHNHFLFRPTTFFPERPPAIGNYECFGHPIVPTLRDQQQERGNKRGEWGEKTIKDEEDSDDETMQISEKASSSKQFYIMRLLKRVMDELQRVGMNLDTLHMEYQCEVCKMEPLKGTRWHCATCTSTSVDYCSNCLIKQLDSSSPHNITHNLVPISSPISTNPIHDPDYTNLPFGGEYGYNYLDPNFMPL